VRRRHLKDLKRLFPAGDQLAVVIDDRSDVWRTSDGVPTQNLLQIPPFRFFPVFHELNALPQDKHEDYHDSNRVQAAADVRLNQMMTVLLDLHARFFAHYDATHKIKSIGEFLREKRRGVLRGTRIMFSSVYGRDDRSMKAVILQMAVQHGADCATELDDVGEGEVELPADVTHVVARFDATSKARAALKTEGVYLVTVDWFMESVVRLQRLPEQDFPVGKRAVIVGEPRKPFTPIVDDAVEDDDDNAGNDDDDDDDDESSDNDGDDDVPEEKAKPTKIAVVKPAEVLGSAAAEDPDGWHDSEDDDDPFGASNAPTTMAIGALPPPKKARVEEPTPPEASAATTGREQSELDQLLDQL
jgi:hypothetical protein